MIKITSLLAVYLILMPFGNGGNEEKDSKNQTNEDVRDTYYKYEREEVDYYRDRVEFTIPPVPVEDVVIEELPDPRRLSGRFGMEDRLIVEADPRLSEFIDKHKRINEQIKEVNGHKVQIYAGRGREGRAEASAARTKFMANYPDHEAPVLKFEHPLYRVHVGNFMRREEAELFCRELRVLFPKALISNVKVKVPKYQPKEDQRNSWDRN